MWLGISLNLTNGDVDPNDKAVGGRVLVLEGDLASRPDIYKGIICTGTGRRQFSN